MAENEQDPTPEEACAAAAEAERAEAAATEAEATAAEARELAQDALADAPAGSDAEARAEAAVEQADAAAETAAEAAAEARVAEGEASDAVAAAAGDTAPPAPDAEEREPSADEDADGDAAPRGGTPSRRTTTRNRPAAAPGRPGAPRPTRRRREPVDADLRVRALAKYVRTSPRKARLVADLVRGKSVQEARAVLLHSTRDAAADWSKVLESAVANAENNHELDGDDLRIAEIKADEGPTLKRFQPRAQGRAFQIRKRTSHLSIQLQAKES